MNGTSGLRLIDPDTLAAGVPAPDAGVEPEGFLVEVGSGERIHFLDWGAWAGDLEPGLTAGPHAEPSPTTTGVLLIHGLSGTAWAWTAVARRLRPMTRTVALDLRGHGLSDAPTHGYDRDTLAGDVVAVTDGAGLQRVVLAGHGFGAIVAAWAATSLGGRCAGLVLVDGGWQDLAAETGMTADEWLRDLAEPPEVLGSMSAFLADRRSWDPGSWTPDEERATRAEVVEVPAGKVVPAVRPHALDGSVEAMFAYRPDNVLTALDGPIVALVAGAAWSAGADEDGPSGQPPDPIQSLEALGAARRSVGRSTIEVARFPADGHNLPRYRPVEVAGAILSLKRADPASG